MGAQIKTLASVTVATSGTEQRLSSTPIPAVKVYISCPDANTGSIYVGDSSVTTTRGTEIPKGVTMVLSAPHGDFLDLKEIFVDAATNGDKAYVSYIEKTGR